MSKIPKVLKPIDKVSLGEITSHRAVTTVNAKVASKMRNSEGRARIRRGEGSMGRRNLADAALPPRRGGSDSTVTRTHSVVGEALSPRMRNHRSKVGRITG